MRNSNDTMTVLGVLGTDPETKVTPSGIPLTKFRMASTQRKFDKNTNTWVDGNTNWYTVSAFRTLGEHAAETLHKGDPVIVTGRLRLRAWDTGEKQGLAVDLEADVIGLDLQWGTAKYKRATHARSLVGAASDGTAVSAASLPVAEETWADAANPADPSEQGAEPGSSTEFADLDSTPF